jgi:SNF2 family DNA or RNA helicase
MDGQVARALMDRNMGAFVEKAANGAPAKSVPQLNNVLMQLRKVCNHPDLFEPRSIESPMILTEQDRIKYHFSSFVYKSLV